MNRDKIYEILTHIITELKSVNLTTPIIVEGERDEQSLRKIGLDGTILKLNVGKSIFNFCETLTDYEKIIILPDWDRKGHEIRDKLKHALFANGIKPDDSYWMGLKHLCSREIKEVEHLNNFLENLKKR
jgi:5S rRNA maturation endonuclease (ribonuclease M5)